MWSIFFWIGVGFVAFAIIIIIMGVWPSTKGWTGERMVRTVLKSLPGDKYIILNDVYFRGNRWSCQIDHLVISPFGIFCIETKNFLGKIEGRYTDKYLRRKVLGMNYKTYSPIHQNYRHLKRLVETFPLIKSHSKDLHSIICFINGGFPRIEGEGAATICKLSQLRNVILGYKTEVISWDDCKEIEKAVRKASKRHKDI